MIKKLLLPASFLIALTGSGQVGFDFFAGPQATTSRYFANDQKQHTEMKYGFQAGIGWKIPFEDKLFFSPAAFYSLKGYKVTFTQFLFPPDVNATDNNTTIHCLELAALLQYDFSSQPSHLYIKGGPSLDFQLFGRERFNLMGGGSVDRKMIFDFTNYGRYSANMLAQFGYETGSGFIIFAQYTYGLGNLNNADDGPTIRHRAFGISIGKYLNRKDS